MTETASILKNATEKSLVLLDEIGRGTSTLDGLALAWAVATAMVSKIRALTLFATHYFELTSLPEDHPQSKNVHLSAKEHDDKIAFMYRNGFFSERICDFGYKRRPANDTSPTKCNSSGVFWAWAGPRHQKQTWMQPSQILATRRPCWNTGKTG